MPTPSTMKEERLAKNSSPNKVFELSKFQRFEMITLQRSRIKGAPYNPRKISPKNKELLKAKIKDVGLIDPPVYNKRTGNLVGGHQRLAALDALEGSRDYSLSVAAVDVDLKTEKEMNIFLNNPKAQGEWDLPILKSLFEDGVSPTGAGFEMNDLPPLFEGLEFNLKELTDAEQAKIVDDVNSLLGKETGEGYRDDYFADFYVNIVFDNETDYKAFLTRMGLTDSKSKKEIPYEKLYDHLKEYTPPAPGEKKSCRKKK